VILLTPAAGAERMRAALAERPWVETCVLKSSDDLAGGFACLRAGGIDRLSCVGGRTLALQLLDRGLVQDLYLTTGTSRGGSPDTPIAHPSISTVVVRKRGTGAEEGVIFEHLEIAPELTNRR
jgi:riboflavin biosynthesis pyrimidine reductase